jgi:hypothetical protein
MLFKSFLPAVYKRPIFVFVVVDKSDWWVLTRTKPVSDFHSYKHGVGLGWHSCGVSDWQLGFASCKKFKSDFNLE